MFLLGTIVNSGLIIIGSMIGRFLHNIPEKVKETVIHGIALTVTVLGLQMALTTENFLIVILSIVFGAMIGEYFDWEEKLNALGLWLEKKLGAKGEGKIAQGFVTATLIYVIGAMAILGALDSGLRNNHDILVTKGIIDGFTAFILTTTLGLGVLFSAVPVLLYEGSIALFATQIDRLVPPMLMEQFITEMTATGGIMIIALGLNLTGLMKIRVANLLPGIIVVGVIVTLLYYFPI